MTCEAKLKTNILASSDALPKQMSEQVHDLIEVSCVREHWGRQFKPRGLECGLNWPILD